MQKDNIVSSDLGDVRIKIKIKIKLKGKKYDKSGRYGINTTR